MTAPLTALSPLALSCQTCGQRSAADGRYHPHLFCVLYLAGIKDQEAYLAASGWVRADEDKPSRSVVERTEPREPSRNLDSGTANPSRGTEPREEDA